MSQFTLWPFQQETIEIVQKDYLSGVNRQLICLPTGSGKTVIMATIAKLFNKRTLILAHRDELITQTRAKFSLLWPDADVGIVKAELNQPNHHVVIGSVQSCSSPQKLAMLKEQGFEVLMIDEAHHAPAVTYQRIINELGFNNGENKLLIGVTATPERNDDKSLLGTFEKVVFHRSIKTMIDEKYLVPVSARKVSTVTSLDKVKSYKGDFAQTSLSKVVNTTQRNGVIVKKYKEHASGRKTVAFCASVKHAQDLEEEFNSNNVRATAVWGGMPLERRRKVLQDFKEGSITIVTTCNVLTEGFDEPSVDCIIMARPTKSRSLYIQSIGRGLRLNGESKTDCLVLDFIDQHHTLDSIITLGDILPSSDEQEVGKNKTRTKGEIRDEIECDDILPYSDDQFDLFAEQNYKQQYVWIYIDNNEWSLADENHKEIIVREIEGGFVADLYIRAKKKTIIKDPRPKASCFMLCEIYAKKYFKISYADLNGTWLRDSCTVQATAIQMDLLKINGIDSTNMTKAVAWLSIGTIFALGRKQRRIDRIIQKEQSDVVR